MTINPKYLICYKSTHRERDVVEHGDIIIDRCLNCLAQSMEEGVNFAMEVTPAGGPYTSIDISCVILTPEVFRKMVEKIDYHDPYFMDLILPDLSTIEQ